MAAMVRGKGVESDFITVRAFAAGKACSVQYAYNLINAGKLKSVRSMATGQILIPRSEFDRVEVKGRG